MNISPGHNKATQPTQIVVPLPEPNSANEPIPPGEHCLVAELDQQPNLQPALSDGSLTPSPTQHVSPTVSLDQPTAATAHPVADSSHSTQPTNMGRGLRGKLPSF